MAPVISGQDENCSIGGGCGGGGSDSRTTTDKLDTSAAPASCASNEDTLLLNGHECAACGELIQDRFYLFADDRKWHLNCLQCVHCKSPLEKQSKCYFRDGHIYCRDDYLKLVVKRCSRCGQRIHPRDLFMRALENIYHTVCFTCVICNTTLTQGDYYGIRNNLVYCRLHYELYNAANSNASGMLQFEHGISGGGINGGLMPLISQQTSAMSLALGNSFRLPPANIGTGGGVGGQFSEFFLSSETAIHPAASSDHYSPMVNGECPTAASISTYGSMYCSPGSGTGGGTPGSSGDGGLSCAASAQPNPGGNGDAGVGIRLSTGGSSSAATAATVATSAPLSLSSSSSSSSSAVAAGSMEKEVSNIRTTVGGTPSNGVRKGRPRKRKTALNLADAHAAVAAAAAAAAVSNGCRSNASENGSVSRLNQSNLMNGDVAAAMLSRSGNCHESTILRNVDQLSNCASIGNIHSSSSSSSGQRAKRMRTSFKHHQLRAMKSYFQANQNPDAKDLKQLAAKTQLSKRVLQVWFQNARAKWRRNNMKDQSISVKDCRTGSKHHHHHHHHHHHLLGTGSLNPDSPSTVVNSPGGSSTQNFSSPSPSLSAHDLSSSGLLSSGSGNMSIGMDISNGSSLDQFPAVSTPISNAVTSTGVVKSSSSLRSEPSPCSPSSQTGCGTNGGGGGGGGGIGLPLHVDAHPSQRLFHLQQHQQQQQQPSLLHHHHHHMLHHHHHQQQQHLQSPQLPQQQQQQHSHHQHLHSLHHQLAHNHHLSSESNEHDHQINNIQSASCSINGGGSGCSGGGSSSNNDAIIPTSANFQELF